MILPREDVIDTDLSVEDGVSILLSAGASIPPAGDARGDEPTVRLLTIDR